MKALLTAYSLEVNTSADYFRGMPDGSWSGNSGALIGVNAGIYVYDHANIQIGGSYGLYNWDGRGNLVFANDKLLEQVGFLTIGASSSHRDITAGLVYDRIFTNNFGIYALNPSFDQLRFQVGRTICCEEYGVWGTINLNTAHEDALGIPTTFKAIGQVNLYWRHAFENCASTMLWAGIPYQSSLMFPHKRAGNVILGFSFRTPLCDQLFLDGNGSYMAPRKSSSGTIQSRNYGYNLCLGLTYSFDDCSSCDTPFLSIANHSNFFVDTNINQ